MYGEGGTNALRRSLGLTGYTTGTSRKHLSSSVGKALQQADKTLPSNLENFELKDIPGIADSARRSAEQVETTLTTINDQAIDTESVTQARRELAGLEKAMTGVRDEVANNLAKLTSIDDRKSESERHLAREHRKPTETDDTNMQREIQDRIRKLESVLSDIKFIRQARLEALSTNRATLRSQINRIRETFRRLLHEDTTMADRIDSHSHRHGDLDPCACAHRRKCAGAGSQAVRQKRFERVGQTTPTAPWARPGKFSWQGRGGPAWYHCLNCLLALEYIRKDCGVACREYVGCCHCCGDPASRGCSGLAISMTAKAPLGQLLFFFFVTLLPCNGLPIALPFPRANARNTCRNSGETARRCSGGRAVAIRLVPEELRTLWLLVNGPGW